MPLNIKPFTSTNMSDLNQLFKKDKFRAQVKDAQTKER